jgi:hypothetical protein
MHAPFNTLSGFDDLRRCRCVAPDAIVVVLVDLIDLGRSDDLVEGKAESAIRQ